MCQGLTFYNSPYYHVHIKDSRDIVIEDSSVYVDYDLDSNMALVELLANETLHGLGMSFKTVIPDAEALELAGLSDDEISLLEAEVLAMLDSYGGFEDLTNGNLSFPMNTDGYDVAGTNVLIRNVTIRNFDDAVAIKYSDDKGEYSTCSSNVIVEDVKVSGYWSPNRVLCNGELSPRANPLFLFLFFFSPLRSGHPRAGNVNRRNQAKYQPLLHRGRCVPQHPIHGTFQGCVRQGGYRIIE